MKLASYLLTYVLIGISIQSSANYDTIVNTDCQYPYQRKEIRSMTVLEVKQLIKALRKIRESLVWDKFIRYHFVSDKYAHFQPIFLPFHRLLLREFEKEIQKYYPKLYLPYWNWGIDSQSPEKSVVLTNYYFGGNGNSKEGFILDEGHFAWDVVPVPEEGYLKRQFDSFGKIKSFPNLEQLEDIMNESTNYTEFNIKISIEPHAAVHQGVGDEEGHLTTMASPGDPLFFLHHCFIDML
ncbi:Di-copper centre-containing protein, partial [Conidiobolus coronatus NRRL 28638]